MDEFLLELQAKLDEAKSKGLINADIEKIQQQVDKLKLQAEIDPKALSNIIKQIEGVLNQKINIGNIKFDSQTGTKIGESVADNIVSGIQKAGDKVSNEIQKITNQSNKIQFKIDNDTYNAKIADLANQFNTLGLTQDEVATKMKAVKTAYAELSSGNLSQEQLIQKEKQFNVELTTTSNHLKILKTEMSQFVSTTKQINLTNKIEKWLTNNTRATKAARQELEMYFQELKSGQVTNARFTEISNNITKLDTEMRSLGKLGKSPFDALTSGISKFSSWISSTYLVMKTINEVRKAISFTTELNSALTNINYTMNVTADQLEQIGQKSISMAKSLNTSAENVLGAVKLYANAKETADTILQKAQPAIMLSNVAGFTGEQSAKYLQTIMNQFDLTQDDLLNISDIIQAVSQNMAHDFSDGIIQINEGIETSGEVARAAGMDLAEYASMIGLLVEKTGLQGSQLGNAVKTIITRTTKAGKILGIDEGEISDAEKSLRNVGIAVRETDGEFREFKDTMKDLSEVWDSLSDVEKSNIAFNLAGTRQINVIQTLLRNWSDYEDLVVKANESVGVTFENQEKYAESLEGKMEGLSATMTSVWENLINEDSVSPVIDILSKFADGLDKVTSKLGLLGTVSVGAGLFAGWKNIGLDENALQYCFE